MRSDGLSAVLRPLLDDRRIVAATLVDVDSGLVLDGYVDDPGEHPALADVELLGAVHADMVKAAALVSGPSLAEITVSTDDGHHHLLHAVPDPYGERLVVAVVVQGAPRHVTRARLRLRTVSVEALTAGPTLARRPVDGRWVVDDTTPAGGDDAAPDPDEDALGDPKGGHDEHDGDEAGTPGGAPAPASAAVTLSAMAPRGASTPASAAARFSGTVSSVAAPLSSGLSSGLASGLSSPLVPVSDARRGTARTGPAGR